MPFFKPHDDKGYAAMAQITLLKHFRLSFFFLLYAAANLFLGVIIFIHGHPDNYFRVR